MHQLPLQQRRFDRNNQLSCLGQVSALGKQSSKVRSFRAITEPNNIRLQVHT